jgi:hypothetical protein
MNSLRLLAASAGTVLLVACGGGSGSDDGGGSLQPPAAGPTPTPMPDPISVAGLNITGSSVQTYGTSTSDLLPGRDPTTASGFALSNPETGAGITDLRVSRDDTGAITAATLILRDLGVSWDGETERPPIIEAFNDTQGRSVLTAAGEVSNVALPDAGSASFWDRSTQANYANNRYFPMTPAPEECPSWWGIPGGCNLETFGVVAGSPGTDWRTGGVIPDNVSAGRLHSDGDIDAPNVPFSGSKGFRALEMWSYAHATLGAWVTQETVLMAEWGAPTGVEHNLNRRGIIATGQPTAMASLPGDGVATYDEGFVYGWYAASGVAEPIAFRGRVAARVDFATNAIRLELYDVVRESNWTPLPLGMAASGELAEGNRGAVVVPVTAGGMEGNLGARFFGPVAAGAGGDGPAEIGGSFRLGNGGASAIGGFVALKRDSNR